MKRKAAIRELVRMRDAGEIGPWEEVSERGVRRVTGWHGDFVLVASRSSWWCYVPAPGATRTLIEVYAQSSLDDAMDAADAWLASLTLPVKGEKAQLREWLAAAEAKIASQGATIGALSASLDYEQRRASDMLTASAYTREQLIASEAKVAELTEDAHRLSAAVGQLSAEVTRLKALNADMALALAQFSTGG